MADPTWQILVGDVREAIIRSLPARRRREALERPIDWAAVQTQLSASVEAFTAALRRSAASVARLAAELERARAEADDAA